MILYIPISLLFSCGNDDNDQKENISDSTEEDCNDMLDNDNDGQIDCDDLDCTSSENCSSDEEQPSDSGEVTDTNHPDDTSEPEDTSSPENTTEENPAMYTLDLGNEVSANFVLIASGTFTMGSPSEEVGRYTEETYGIDEEQYDVTLSQDFYVLTTEVTQGMFEALMNYDAREEESTNYGTGTNRPTYYSSWHMAAAFANSMTERHNINHESNLEMCYNCEGDGIEVQCSESLNPYQCEGYRLLTEAEWEFSARAGSTFAIWTPNGGGNLLEDQDEVCSPLDLSDGTPLSELGWYCGNAPAAEAQNVGEKLPNNFGLFDMHGNVWEWTHDGYGPYPNTPTTNPISSGTEHVIRGGGWNHFGGRLRSASRYKFDPTYRDYDIGFRVGRCLP